VAVALPGFQELTLPALRAMADGAAHRERDVLERVVEELRLPPEDRAELLPSGGSRLGNRIGWALTYMAKAGLLDRSRGIFRITDEGRRVLQDPPSRLDVAYLRRFPAFQEWGRAQAATTGGVTGVMDPAPLTDEDPDETMDRLWRSRTKLVARDLLEQILKAPPSFFEQLVIRLLVAMGYGGSFADAARAVGRTGDEGIDGVIKEDRLGLDAIYVQAKRWQSTVGRPEIQRFAGSLEGARARKGVFITTSSFSPEAREYVERIDKRIVLVDGPTLSDLMIEHGIGVTTARTYVIPRIDAEFFEASN
jgi:restriction system protein